MSEIMKYRAHNEFVEEHDTNQSSPSNYTGFGLLKLGIRVIFRRLVGCFNNEMCFQVGKKVKDNEKYEEKSYTEQPAINYLEFS
jgi:hypothetical protein